LNEENIELKDFEENIELKNNFEEKKLPKEKELSILDEILTKKHSQKKTNISQKVIQKPDTQKVISNNYFEYLKKSSINPSKKPFKKTEIKEKKIEEKIETVPDKKDMNIIGLYCDYVGIDDLGMNDAVGRVVLIDINENIIYDKTLKNNIVDYRYKETGLKYADFVDSIDLKTLRIEISPLIKNKIIITVDNYSVRNFLYN
jgi:hypothetical protein